MDADRRGNTLIRFDSGGSNGDAEQHTAMIVTRPAGPTSAQRAAPAASSDALRLYDTNGNTRITCKEARQHGIAPVPRGHPAYSYMHDRDGDGVVCE